MSPSERLPLLVLLLLQGSVLGGDPAPVPQPFLETHCVGCHGPDVRKAGLRLDTLGTDLRDKRTMATWVRVHDQLAAGAMPPKTSDQPPPREREVALRDLHRALHSASLARQQEHGRAAVRRLNATEYENTVRELVGTNVPLRDLLPEDGAAAGFDNVGSALELSATHLLRYQEAAERAVRSAVPEHPPVPFRDRRTGREISAKGPNFKQTLDRSCVLDGDALVIYSKLPRYGLCSTAAVPADGRYRVRMSVSAVGAEGKAVPAAFQVVGSGREDPVTFDVRDVAPGRPQVVELDVDLTRRQAFVVNVLTTWDIRGFKKPIAEYTGPGVRVEWLEIDGPVGPFPPPSYDRQFAGVPLKPRSVAKALAEGRPPPKIAENRNLFAWQADPLVPVSADPKADAERLIRSFAARAFRRPVPDDVTARIVARVHEKLDAKAPFFEAMTFGFTALLSSPHFLLLAEPGPKLDDFALACRLSYFLWSGPPGRRTAGARNERGVVAAGRAPGTGRTAAGVAEGNPVHRELHGPVARPAEDRCDDPGPAPVRRFRRPAALGDAPGNPGVLRRGS